MKAFQYIFLLLIALVTSTSVWSQLNRVSVETYYISDANDATDTTGGGIAVGTTTYRVYLHLEPNTRLTKIFGSQKRPLKFQSTQPFFNNRDGQTFGKDFLRARYGENTIALDTWLTIDQTSKKQGKNALVGVQKSKDNNGSVIGGTNNDGGSEEIATGLLTNAIAAIGIPLTQADGMDTSSFVPTGWTDSGIKNALSGEDLSIFGYDTTQFECTNCQVQVNPFKKEMGENTVLIGQFSTKGEWSFELNLELEYLIDGDTVLRRYVATSNDLEKEEVYNAFLKYPFACGCTDPDYIEFNPAAVCDLEGACVNRAVIGCTDTMACNFDPKANVSVHNLCCYPGFCANRDIAVVCPSELESQFKVACFPNPFLDELNLHVTSGEIQEVSYILFDAFGTPILTGSYTPTMNSDIYTIDTSKLALGAYTVQIRTALQVENVLIIKQ